MQSIASPNATRKGLNQLFSKVGIDEIEIDTYGGVTDHGMPLSLRKFIPQVIAKFHESISIGGAPDTELRATKAALYFVRKIGVTFDAALYSGTIYQTEMVQKLSNIINTCPDSLCNVKIGFGTGFTVDPMGTLWIKADAHEKEWSEFFNNVNLEDIQNIHKRRSEMNGLASDVAKNLGVKLIYTDAESVLRPEYEQFLVSMASGSLAELDIPKDKKSQWNEIYIYVKVDHLDQNMSAKLHGDHGKSECTTGTITIPADLSPREVLQILYTVGHKAQLQATKIQKERKELESLKKQVERKLRLRQVIKDPNLADHLFRTGCIRLIDNATTLTPLLDGLSIRLTETNAFVPGKNYIDIAWSFQI